ncbi:hypothetical protein [Chroococcidiopsis sp. CCNUC1]|uniref:hypothetical protein n=1 Tax=Chroococcidiopsis sp. CCNUC1 TaxID=2653189 RepID=UPI002020C18C|nr:hypothetical protein [Chroococcidiopsis sp. CCNUC1]URD50744.1 hypothetical protein M5J74_01865 [Chroococcidiopsis sp. CCNUC1]
MGLIDDLRRSNDPRNDVNVQVPPPPPPQPPAPPAPPALPEEDATSPYISYDQPEPSLQEQLLLPMQDSDVSYGLEMPPTVPRDGLEGGLLSGTIPTMPAAEPAPPPIDDSVYIADSVYGAEANLQIQKEQLAFQSQLDRDAQSIILREQHFPVLYERPSFTAYNENMKERIRLMREKDAAARAAAEDVPQIPPGQGVSTSSKQPQFDSTRNPLKSGEIPGYQRTDVSFDPIKGTVQGFQEIAKNPLDPRNYLQFPVLSATGGQWGEWGKGVLGGLFYTLSLGENVAKGALTDIYNQVTGNKPPTSNQPPATVQAVIGKNYDFSQEKTPEKPLGFVGSETAPKTITELQNRSVLYNLVANPWTWGGIKAVKKAITGNENINVPDFVLEGLDGKPIIKVPGGKMLQGVEATGGFIADVAAGALVDRGLGDVAKVANKFRTVEEATTEAIKKPASNLPKQQVKAVSPVNQPPGLLSSGGVVQPTVTKPIAKVVVEPRPTAPVVPNTAAVMEKVANPPTAYRVNSDLLHKIPRSNEQLTQMGKFVGIVPPTRTTPYSTARLNVMTQNPELESVMSKYGPPLDETKLLPQEPPTVVIPDPVPPTKEASRKLVMEKLEQMKTASPEEQVKLRHDIDRLLDNETNVPDVLQPGVLREVQKELPKELHASSPEGMISTQKYLVAKQEYTDASAIEAKLRSEFSEEQEIMMRGMDSMIDEPNIGRQVLLEQVPTPKPRDFIEDGGEVIPLKRTPSPIATELAEGVNSLRLYHGSKVSDLNLTLDMVDPIEGAARSEFGPAIYLTSDMEEAGEHAKKFINDNLPAANRQFDQVGSVYEVTTKIHNPLDGMVAPPREVDIVFRTAVKEFFGDEVAQEFSEKIAGKPLSRYYTSLDEIVGDINPHEFPEAKVLSFQRLVNQDLRNMGYDAIVVKGNYKDRGTIVAILDNGATRGITAINDAITAGRGTMIEQATEGFNVAVRHRDLYPDDVFAQVQLKEATSRLHSHLVQQTVRNIDEAEEAALRAAHRMADSEDELMEIARIDKQQKEVVSLQMAERQTKKQIAEDAKPDVTHCI